MDIAIEMLQPLLRTDLTDAERISNTFRIAATVIHETAVSISRVIVRPRNC